MQIIIQSSFLFLQKHTHRKMQIIIQSSLMVRYWVFECKKVKQLKHILV